MENNQEQENRTFLSNISTSPTIRFLIIGILTLILLLPANMISDLINERKQRQTEAVQEVNNSWALSQTITGPIVAIPFRYIGKDAKGNETVMFHTEYYLPDDLVIKGDVKSEKRKRGIFDAVVYKSNLFASGDFKKESFVLPKGVSESNIVIDEIKMYIGVKDVRGIHNKVLVQIDSSSKPALPGMDADLGGNGFFIYLDYEDIIKGFSFKIPMEIAGSQKLLFTPVAKNTTVELESDWPDPSFSGFFLPTKRSINEKGFTAKWNVLELNRSFKQHWSGINEQLNNSDFGVNLWIGAGEYQKTHRAIHYCILFIALTFVFYLIVEMKAAIHVHPVQYLLIGLAICVFYLLLLSIGEWIGFDKSFFISSALTTTLISVFSLSVLQSKKWSLITFGVQSLLYIFLYSTLQLQDLALLIGTIGIFFALALLMYFTSGLNKRKELNNAVLF